MSKSSIILKPSFAQPEDSGRGLASSSRLLKGYFNDISITGQSQTPEKKSIKPTTDEFVISCFGFERYSCVKNSHNNTHGPIQLKGFPEPISQISAGENHVIFLTRSNSVYVAGDNSYGQLGLENLTFTPIPTLVPGLISVEVISVACGAEHSFALSSKGEVYSWGLNLKGQLGLGHFDKVDRPTLIESLLPNRAAGREKERHRRNHSLITLPNRPALGTAIHARTATKQRSSSIDFACETIQTTEPAQENLLSSRFQNQLLENDERIIEVACGALHTLLRSDRNRLWSCGYGGNYALGHGNLDTQCEFKPIRFASRLSDQITKIGCGLSHSGCIRAGRAYIWGVYGSKPSQSLVSPTAIEIRKGSPRENGEYEIFNDIVLGDCLTLLLSTGGEVYSMGDPVSGQLGQNDAGCSPKLLEIPERVLSTVCGRNFAFAITETRQVYGWGLNENCQLGVQTTEKYLRYPILLPTLTELDPFSIACGSFATYMISSKAPYVDPLPSDRKLIESRPSLSNMILSEPCDLEGYKAAYEEIRLKMKKLSKENEKYKRDLSLSRQNSMLLATERGIQCSIGEDGLGQEEERGREKSMERSSTARKRNKSQRALSIDVTDNPQKMLTPQFEIDFKEITLEKQVSEGGYGLIYRGKWRETTVAVKMLKAESMKDENIADFLRECHSMSCLRHPNIVMFLGACIKPPNLAIVLEFCNRGTLWSLSQNLEINLTWEDRRRLALDTARAMNYLHLFNPPVLHRDLKSLNLLLDDSFRVKLADFGWTRTKSGLMTSKIGTYQWMAPEVIAGQNYSEKADVYSFGIIMWEMASREPPFKHLSGVQVSLEVVNNDLRPPIPKKTPDIWTKMMKRCWDRDPSKRPSFKEIIKELEVMKF